MDELKLAILMFNCGYALGHHDTVESNYTDILECDMYTFHDDVVKELLDSHNEGEFDMILNISENLES